MSKLEQLYILKKDGETKKVGTVQELADYSGLTVKTIYSYASTTKRNRWEVIQTDRFLPSSEVAVDRIKDLMKDRGCSAAELSAHLGISRSSLNVKLAGKTRFKESELSSIAAYFDIEGDLKKEE